MRRLAGIALALALTGGNPALAQGSSDINPAKITLSRQLIEMSGGQRNAELMIRQSYAMVDQAFTNLATPEKQGLIRRIQQDMQEELIKLVPAIVDQSIEIYARNLTVKELTDMIAWQSSETGRSVTAKLPTIIQESATAQTPLMRELLPRILQKSVEQACAEAKCSTSERQEVEQALNRALRGNGG